MIKKLMLGFVVGGALLGCDSKEKLALQTQNDSLRTELVASKKVETTLSEVGVLLDSIDADRQTLNANMVEGTAYSNYTTRLNSINRYLKETRNKIDELEKTLKNTSSSYVGTIKRLKADIESRTAQIAMLEAEVSRVKDENQGLAQTVSRKDSAITKNSEIIKMKNSDIADLEIRMAEAAAQSKATQADLYFAEAQALESAAQRTKFAPHKKKETKKQALELYKVSLSLGKTEAQDKVTELEKSI